MKKTLISLIMASTLTTSYASEYVVMVKEDIEGNRGFTQVPLVLLEDLSIYEPDSVETVKVPINLSKYITNSGSVEYTIEHLSTTDDDLTLKTGSVNFDKNKTTGYANIIINGDTFVGEDKTFKIKIFSPNYVKIVENEAIVTIKDNDQYPELLLEDIEVIETDSGLFSLSIPVKLANSNNVESSIDYTTNLVTASSTDVTEISGTLNFAVGETEKSLLINIAGDLIDEEDETFELVFSNPQNLTLNNSKLTGTILDNNEAPSISISDLNIDEGDSGVSYASVPVELSAYSGREIKVNYSSTALTASNDDYTDVSGVLTFAKGELIKYIQVPINGDYDYEEDKTVSLTLSNPINATIADSETVLTIANDDSLYQFNTLPLYGIVEYNDNVNGWQQVIAGTEYSNQYEFRYNPTESEVLAVSKDIKIGSFDTNPSTPYYADGNHSISDWGTVSGNKATYKSNGVTVVTSLSNGNLAFANSPGTAIGVGLGSSVNGSHELNSTTPLTINLSGDFLNDVEITADGLGSCYDLGNGCETKVVIKAYDFNGALIDTQGGYRKATSSTYGEAFIDTYNFTGQTAIKKFIISIVPTNVGGNNPNLKSGSNPILNMTISRSAFEEIDYELKNAAGESSSETLKLNINEGNANTNVELNDLLLK